MPIRNMGMLLENIVLVETMRLLAQQNQGNEPVDFLNSFAMPPLSGWCTHTTDYGFGVAQLNALQAGPQPAPADSYQGILWSCLQQPLGQPGTLGPNGALLCTMLAHQLTCPIRLWLNDIPNGHYGNALPGLGRINATVQQVLGLAAAPQSVFVVCGSPWPDCLAQPPGINLTDTLAAWGDNAHARLGFLDPMRYRVNNGEGGETDSASHQEWLRLLSTEACPVISVHFTGHRNWNDLRPEVQHMHADGFANGYHHTLVARHGHYHAVCNIKTAQSSQAARTLAGNLQQMLEAAWGAWFQAIGRARDALTIEVL